MRCPDCERFVSFDTEVEPETDLEMFDDTVQVSVRRVLACADCGTELKETQLELEMTLESIIDDCTCQSREAWEATEDLSPTVETQTHDRHGKPIKRARYQRTYYGVEGTITVRCDECGAEETAQVGDRAQASWFEEMV